MLKGACDNLSYNGIQNASSIWIGKSNTWGIYLRISEADEQRQWLKFIDAMGIILCHNFTRYNNIDYPLYKSIQYNVNVTIDSDLLFNQFVCAVQLLREKLVEIQYYYFENIFEEYVTCNLQHFYRKVIEIQNQYFLICSLRKIQRQRILFYRKLVN